MDITGKIPNLEEDGHVWIPRGGEEIIYLSPLSFYEVWHTETALTWEIREVGFSPSSVTH